MIYIVAGSSHEARVCASQHHLSPTQYREVFRKEQLYGHKGGEIWLYGNYGVNPDYRGITETAKFVDMSIKYVSDIRHER
jgi:hypothetical protein